MEVSGKLKGSGKKVPVGKTDKICEPCTGDNITKQSDGFCKECEEYMCNTCFKHHLKGKLCRTHVMIDGHLSSTLSGCQKTEVKCKQHVGETINFYCSNHDSVGCGSCVAQKHSVCKVEIISHLSTNFRESQDFKTLMSKIEKLSSVNDINSEMIQENKQNSKVLLEYALSNIEQFREEFNKYLDEIEADVISKANTLVTDNDKILNDLENHCEILSTKIEDIKQQLNEKYFQDNALFINTVENRPNVSEMENEVNEIQAKELKKFEFVPDKQLHEFVTSNRRLGQLVTTVAVLNPQNSQVKDCEKGVAGTKTNRGEASKFLSRLRNMAVGRINSTGAVKIKGPDNKKDDDTVFETFYHRSGKKFQCIYESGMRFYLDEWGSKEWKPFPKRWYNEGLIVTNTILKNENVTQHGRNEQTKRTSGKGQSSRTHGLKQGQGVGSGDDREGFLIHPTKGRVPTYIFHKKQNVHMYFDRESRFWVRMPIAWELHHEMVKSLVDEIDNAVPTWGDRRDILALLRAYNYDPDECISTYKHLENDEWMKGPLTSKENKILLEKEARVLDLEKKVKHLEIQLQTEKAARKDA